MDLFAGLNPAQSLAVHTIAGRVLILAGAGTGKTRVLTLRMAHLIKKHNCSPRSILGLTFTNKAAAEMRQRLATFVDIKTAKQVTLCTFHSFCMQVLRDEIHRLGYTQSFTLYDEKDVQRLIAMIARDLLDHEGELPSMAPTTEMISLAKNKGLKTEEMIGTGSVWHDEFAQNVYSRLQDSMRAYNAVDFDSLLSLTVDLFERFPDVLEAYQERYRYIMIDEYQDTNPIQYRLASLLAAKYQNLCVVGDDDQSIYGWRGADIQNILSFSSETVVKLEQNYRSTNTILKAANAVIHNNQTRHLKALWSDKGDGDLIEVFHAPNEIEEAQAVVCRMDKMREKYQLKWKDMAILYRSNALSRSVEQALLKHSWKDGNEWVRGVPYQIFGGTEFYERREVKDLIAYLRVIVNPRDEEALLRIINFPRRGIGEGALDVLTAHNRSHQVPLWQVLNEVSQKNQQNQEAPETYRELVQKISSKAMKGICEFLDIMATAKKKFADLSMRDAMLWFLETLNYQKALAEEVKSTQMREFKWENVQEFVSSLADYEAKFTSESTKKPSLQDYVLGLALFDGWGRKSSHHEEDKVSLMTFHSAKGLEFPACFLIGMEDHILPHEKSLKQTGVEEERRLMYVAVTRAKKFLTISMARQRKRMGIEATSSPSRFILEIPKEYMKMSLWHQV
jgi:DNA helicase II / ATP-dependent DNA helicase PcrA